jgi:hypothetical protein
MTFGLVRCGWPNSAAIAALALLPLAAFTLEAKPKHDVRSMPVEAASYCTGDADRIAALTSPEMTAVIQ